MPIVLLASAAILASAACNAEKAQTSGSDRVRADRSRSRRPTNGDWSEMVSETPEGGFLMGNPNADGEAGRIGSMTCPHCAEFDEAGRPSR